MKDNLEKDIILINKPVGITSFDVIRELRKKLGVKKMGHAGTLDPLASGLMIIGVGENTKKLNEYLKLDKTYKASILLGQKTTTGDLEGDVVEEKKVNCNELDSKNVSKVLESMVGELDLQVPLYSAVKIGGKPLYKYAREGRDIQPPIKTMKIKSMVLGGIKSIDGKCTLDVELEVSSGTYIRSIAEELGQRLDMPATLSGLERLTIGEFHIKNARQLSDF